MSAEEEDRARRQAEHEKPPKGVTREDWLATFPTVEDFDRVDEQIWGPLP